ncbi:MBL fold metallo-hydrolase [Actinomadura fibrosa]|uniref:MBL fold metallo-hydrolase n=1 Tax=Actinomadura fibrosa TaxID=111802 RepID=A0ABW2XDT7_9ACTN|nr:MBL fold metallo-hydrolase [Actinomadura fibrosa]
MLLAETDASGLVLVDAGIGLGDIADPSGRLHDDWIEIAGPVLDPGAAAVRQVVALGYQPEDVRHIAVTHLHRDHAGGLSDFPEADVHLFEAERVDGGKTPKQLAHGPKWVTYEGGGDVWKGFAGVRPLEGVDEDIALVPLHGHTPGHAGVAVRDGDRWLLHAGDAYMYHGEVDRAEPVTHPLMELVQMGGEVDREQRLEGVARLRELVLDPEGDVEVFSSHDPWELRRYV